ncbi:phage tail protein [Pyxidicoccus caerfyrddinensis]|uniref:phage tail protein n=1 Tax=Pyxidicoccus caerfyrddinensis TaxID=2709663 RepID=UPI0013DCEA6B|nr:hypothetical protein [Pyxidicoccus caerfyrddinensis]
MPAARAAARGPSRAPARGGAGARAGGGATTAAAPGGAAVKVGGDAEKDPRFRKVIEQLEKSSKKTKQHPPAAQKASEAQAAAVSPPSERTAGAKANQVDAMKSAEAPKAEPSGFLALLREEIEKVMPKNLDDADKFMEGNETAQVKGAVSGGVKEQKDTAAGPTEQASAAPPDTGSVPARQSAPLPEEPAVAPPPVNGADAMPAPKPAAEVQALGKPKQDADQQMKEAELTPERLKKANDPRFSAVMSQKTNVDKVATVAPGKYVSSETATLGQAKGKASGDAKSGVAQMGGVKVSGNTKVKARQLLAKQRDEARRKEVSDHIEKLYQTTKQRVDTKLSTLEADVMRLFDLGAEAALADMKSYANREIDKFKDDRYSGLRGKARWLADLFRPVPEGIKVILGQARTRFAAKMDALAVRISTMVDTRLADAKAEVDKGQGAIKAYVDSLPKDLQAVGREAQQAMSDRFEELRSGIDSKKNDLAQKLAQKYKEAHDKADSALKKLEEENAGALKKLADAIGEVIKILTEFKDKLMAVLRKGLETIKLILADPIGFLGNLLAAIKQGFTQFVGNIWTHLKKGFMTWLFGSLAEAGIQVPSDLNVWSILKLVLDVLGLTYAWMRSEAVKLMGERNVALLEKLVEYITITIKGGPQALWEKLKEDLSNLKEMVIDAIQNWLIETIVKQAVTKILSMFNPAGAIVQAIIAIYNVVMWVIENASRIVALIEAVVNSVHAIATGAIGGAANWIENALANLIPIVIAFLARLIGLGGISKKIRDFITKVQTKVRAAVIGWLKKAWAYVKKLFGGGGKGKPDDKRTAAEKQRDLDAAVREAKELGTAKRLRRQMGALKTKYRLTSLEGTEKEGVLSVKASINPESTFEVADDHWVVKMVRTQIEADVRALPGSAKEAQVRTIIDNAVKVIKTKAPKAYVEDGPTGEFGEIPVLVVLPGEKVPLGAVWNPTKLYEEIGNPSGGSQKLFRARSNKQLYVHDAKKQFVPRYIIRNITEEDLKAMNLSSTGEVRGPITPTGPKARTTPVEHVMGKKPSPFISATRAPGGDITNPQGETFVSPSGKVRIDLTFIDPKAILDLSTRVGQDEWNFTNQKTDIGKQALADVKRTQEVLIKGTIPAKALTRI